MRSTLVTGASLRDTKAPAVHLVDAEKNSNGQQWFANSNSSSGNEIQYKKLFQETGNSQFSCYGYSQMGVLPEGQYPCLNTRHSMSNILVE